MFNKNRKMNNELERKTTLDLAFGLASGKYSEAEKFTVLQIINSRESQKNPVPILEIENNLIKDITESNPKIFPFLKLKKGSKAEKIYNLFKDGFTAAEIFIKLNKGDLKVTNSEIYRIKNLIDENTD